ncbi:MAG: Hsp20/alpha crystallin family protein [Gammaproteobacteria bacterium]|jgi:HSP20 family protein|nr:Hsp20/alpha crystallin family protein [Gammaproteobacteria bacterium]
MLPKTYEPWSLMNQWRRDMERALGQEDDEGNYSKVTTAAWAPAVDIKEEDDAFVLHADLPGVKPDDIEVNMDNGVLCIKGSRQSEAEEKSEQYSRVERVSGSFYRRFSLPDTADAEKITARCSDGVLEVRIPKHEKLQPRKISVSS